MVLPGQSISFKRSKLLEDIVRDIPAEVLGNAVFESAEDVADATKEWVSDRTDSEKKRCAYSTVLSVITAAAVLERMYRRFPGIGKSDGSSVSATYRWTYGNNGGTAGNVSITMRNSSAEDEPQTSRRRETSPILPQKFAAGIGARETFNRTVRNFEDDLVQNRIIPPFIAMGNDAKNGKGTKTRNQVTRELVDFGWGAAVDSIIMEHWGDLDFIAHLNFAFSFRNETGQTWDVSVSSPLERVMVKKDEGHRSMEEAPSLR